MYRLEFRIDGLPKVITNGSQGSWKASHFHKKKWKRAVAFAVRYKEPESPLKAAKVECVRHSSVKPDRDNLAASFKACVDGLVDAGVLEDDSDEIIKEMNYRWEKAKPGKGFIMIVVEEVE